MKILAWLRRDRVAELKAAHQLRERDEMLLTAALRAVDTVYPDSALNPGTTQWPEMCVPGDPCRTKWNNDADRGEWYDCANHQPRGRHRIRPAVYATVTDVPEVRNG